MNKVVLGNIVSYTESINRKESFSRNAAYYLKDIVCWYVQL
jgi:hypothetical protein